MFLKIDKIIEKIDYNMLFDLIALNEVSGKVDIATRFSDAKSGKSGYSFGISQFDVSHNQSARDFLLSHGFTNSDLKRLLAKDPHISDLNNKLKLLKKEIHDFDVAHIKSSCKYIASLSGIPQLSIKTFAHLLDYHNQFNLSRNGKMHNFLKMNPNYLLASEILQFKLENTKWGKEHPSDIWRRYKNIEKYFDINIYNEGGC